MENKTLVEFTFEIDQDLYDGASQVFKAWDTSVEEMATALIYFCAEPDNLPLLESFMNESLDQETKRSVDKQLFSEVLKVMYYRRTIEPHLHRLSQQSAGKC